MIKKSHGSVMILFFMITALMLVVSFSCWYKMSLLADLLDERKQASQHFYLTEIFFNEGVKLAQQSFDYLIDQKLARYMPFTITIQTPPFFQNKLVTGELTITQHSTELPTLALTMTTHYNQTTLFTIRGLLSKNIQARVDHAQKKSCYELHHVTFGVPF